MKPEVSLCIPAWQAEAFIEKTLDHARAQTWPGLRILVSVDQCDDDTASICNRFATEDKRIRVFVQERRQGWAGNVNFLLSRVATPLFAFYWHDDIIPPDYVEHLASALADRPDAMSAYGNTQHFGSYTELETGQPFEGDVASRLVDTLLTTNMAGMARYMGRRELIELGLHIPHLDGDDYFENCWPWILQTVAAGPVLHVPGAVYERLNGAGSSIVDGWRRSRFEKGLAGLQQNARDCLAVIRNAEMEPDQYQAARYCLYLFMTYRTRLFEVDCQHPSLTWPALISPEFKGLPAKDALQLFDEKRRDRVLKCRAELFFLEGRHWLNRDDPQRALGAFVAAAMLDSRHPWAGVYVVKCLRELDQGGPANAIYTAQKYRKPDADRT